MLNHLFCSFLNSKGLGTISVTGLAAARQVLQTDPAIDLILLDYQLEDGVGMDLLHPTAMETYRSLAPVIMISANEESSFLERCFLGGINDYIIKPVNLSLLALKVETMIRSVSMQRLISAQNDELERFKYEAEREEQIAKFTYEYLLRRNSHAYQGVDVWLKSFAAFSGDMMLVKKSPGGNLYFILADATGHGLSAAITIMPVVSVFNSMVSKGYHLQQIAIELNRKLIHDTPTDRFVAAILVEMNPLQGELSVWSGGMPPAFWIDRGEIKHEFSSRHMALGIMDEDMFDATLTTLPLPRDGMLLVYSDGLSEQEDKDGVAFSVGRVRNIVRRNPENLMLALTSALREHACTDTYDDDVSICLVNPQAVFTPSLVSESERSRETASQPNIGPFSWQLELRGAQLAQCELPPLCHDFLQKMGVDHQRCQKIFTVIAEMVSNALDHGVLHLDSSLKEEEDGFLHYFLAREERLRGLTDKDFLRVHLNWETDSRTGSLVVSVEDSGDGYDAAFPKITDSDLAFSGRGIQLIRQLSAWVEIIPPGNQIRARIK
jgi:serine phosphatase RsbU (regulator of sigma subunit)